MRNNNHCAPPALGPGSAVLQFSTALARNAFSLRAVSARVLKSYGVAERSGKRQCCYEWCLAPRNCLKFLNLLQQDLISSELKWDLIRSRIFPLMNEWMYMYLLKETYTWEKLYANYKKYTQGNYINHKKFELQKTNIPFHQQKHTNYTQG